MALETAVGEFALETSGAGGTQAVTGVGFTPKALIFFTASAASGSTSGASYQRVIGFASSSSAEYTIGDATLDGLSKSGGTRNWRHHSEQALAFRDGGVSDENFDVASFDSDGFTLNKNTVNEALNIKYIALGGDDLTNVAIDAITMPAVTGTQAYTGVGFQPDVVLALCAAVASGGYALSYVPSLYSFGVAKSSSERWAIGVSGDGTSNPGKTSRVLDTTALIHVPYRDAEYLKVDLESMDASGFTLDFETLPSGARYLTVLALKGPRSAIGTDTALTTTGVKQTTTSGVDPSVVLLGSHNSATVDSVINGDASFALGAGVSASSRHAMWDGSGDASGANHSSSHAHSNTSALIDYTENSGSPSLVREADIDSLGSSKFKLDWTTVDSTAAEFGYLALGDSALSESVDAMWAGAATTTTFDVAVIVSSATSDLKLQVATDEDFASVVYTSSSTATSTLAGAGELVKFQATGLTADTAYYYRVTFEGTAIDTIGQVRTTQTAGTAKSFTVAIGSCSDDTALTPNSRVFEQIALSGAQMFIHLGDIHYGDNTSSDAQSVFRADILTHMQLSRAAHMYRSMAMAYTYDDHDFGPNDNNMATSGFATFAARTITAYTDMVPHYTQQQPSGGSPHVRGITQLFDIGRVRFIMPDLRAFASYTNTLLGDGNTYNSLVTWDGETWLTDTLDDCVTDGVALVVLLSGRTWIQGTSTFDSWEEKWSAYQATVAEYLCDNGIPALVAAGDGHMMGFDDGAAAASDFTSGKGQIPSFMTSPLNNSALTTTGPYEWQTVATERPSSGSAEHHQYVLLSITDDGTDLDWTIEGFDETGASVLGPVGSADDTPELNFTAATASVDEDGTSVVLTVTKDWFTPCSCSYASADGTAVAGTHYTAVSGTLTWGGVGDSQTITVPVVDIAGWNGNRSFTVTISGADGATIGSTSTVTVTILDTSEATVQPDPASVGVNAPIVTSLAFKSGNAFIAGVGNMMQY